MPIVLRGVLCVGLVMAIIAGLALLTGSDHERILAAIATSGVLLSALTFSAIRRLPKPLQKEVFDDLAGYPRQLLSRTGFLQ